MKLNPRIKLRFEIHDLIGLKIEQAAVLERPVDENIRISGHSNGIHIFSNSFGAFRSIWKHFNNLQIGWSTATARSNIAVLAVCVGLGRLSETLLAKSALDDEKRCQGKCANLIGSHCDNRVSNGDSQVASRCSHRPHCWTFRVGFLFQN